MRRILQIIHFNKATETNDIIIISKRTKSNLINELFKNENNQIEYDKLKMGIYWNSKNIKKSYKLKENILEVLNKMEYDNDHINAFLCEKNSAIQLLFHPIIYIELNKNNALTLVYFTKTNGDCYNMVYFDVKKNRIYVVHKLNDVINLENIKIGVINVNTLENSLGSIEEYILKNDDNFTYYEFTSDLNYDSINNDSINLSDKQVLNALLDQFECNNFEEVKIKLLISLCDKVQNVEIPIKYNGIVVTNDIDVYDNLSDIQKENLKNLREDIVQLFIDFIERKF